jgi:pyroglutamyl-peptidase
MISVRVGLRHAAASAIAGGWFPAIDRIWCASAPHHRENRMKAPRMKALVTGFEPFGGDKINPARDALPLLPRRLGDIEIATWILPTVFGRALDALDDALTATRPDLVLCVGLAGGRAALSLERVAINLDDARIPDNDGRTPIDRAIVPDGPPAYFATLPIKAAVLALREAGLPAIVSNTAGTFVCNHLFYGLMHRAAASLPGLRGGFLHVPYLPAQAARIEGAPSVALADIVRGIEIVLAVAASRSEDMAALEGAIS